MASERALRARFYEEVTEDLKAEFINGTVVKHSPVKDRHLAVRDSLHELLRTFCRVHRLGTVRGEKALCTFPRNDYEPDVVFFGPAKASLIEPTTMKFPIPDFICEVLSPSTELYDRGVKFRDFERTELANTGSSIPSATRLSISPPRRQL
jgi:Uma2 family endonuclease